MVVHISKLFSITIIILVVFLFCPYKLFFFFGNFILQNILYSIIVREVELKQCINYSLIVLVNKLGPFIKSSVGLRDHISQGSTNALHPIRGDPSVADVPLTLPGTGRSW